MFRKKKFPVYVAFKTKSTRPLLSTFFFAQKKFSSCNTNFQSKEIFDTLLQKIPSQKKLKTPLLGRTKETLYRRTLGFSPKGGKWVRVKTKFFIPFPFEFPRVKINNWVSYGKKQKFSQKFKRWRRRERTRSKWTFLSSTCHHLVAKRKNSSSCKDDSRAAKDDTTNSPALLYEIKEKETSGRVGAADFAAFGRDVCRWYFILFSSTRWIAALGRHFHVSSHEGEKGLGRVRREKNKKGQGKRSWAETKGFSCWCIGVVIQELEAAKE